MGRTTRRKLMDKAIYAFLNITAGEFLTMKSKKINILLREKLRDNEHKKKVGDFLKTHRRTKYNK